MVRLLASVFVLWGLGPDSLVRHSSLVSPPSGGGWCLMAAQTPDAAEMSFSKPATIAELETRRFKGDPVRLAWSPDMKALYVQFAERDKRGAISKLTHVTVASDGTIDTSTQEPPWAAKYWAWKSAQASPVAPAFRIVADSKEETVRSTGASMGGDLARGGGGAAGAGAGTGVTVDEITAATNQAQKVITWTLRLKGEVIGEWVNQAVVPGLTFGWSATQPVIAYSARGGDLVVMDGSGRKKEVEGLDDTLLPAWSDDGSKIAMLLKDGRQGFTLAVVDVR